MSDCSVQCVNGTRNAEMTLWWGALHWWRPSSLKQLASPWISYNLSDVSCLQLPVLGVCCMRAALCYPHNTWAGLFCVHACVYICVHAAWCLIHIIIMTPPPQSASTVSVPMEKPPHAQMEYFCRWLRQLTTATSCSHCQPRCVPNGVRILFSAVVFAF